MKIARISKILFLVTASALLSLSTSACAGKKLPLDPPGVEHLANKRFLSSGTIIVSHQVPDASSPIKRMAAPEKTRTPEVMAPILGYFPPVLGYAPAENETWLKIDTGSNILALYKGSSVIKEFNAEGKVTIGPGDFNLQHKQKSPVWYAPDDYFAKRKLATPKAGDALRYRRGALGAYVLYPTTTFPIHCGPVWSEDVGGLKVSASDLSSIYYMLPVGAPIIVE